VRHGGVLGDESDDLHLAAAERTQERVDLVHLYGVSAADLWTYVVVVTILAGVAVLATPAAGAAGGRPRSGADAAVGSGLNASG
jgi:hypothetical protein